MIYPYIVVKDGVWYDAGNDVPETSKPETEKLILMLLFIPRPRSTECQQTI